MRVVRVKIKNNNFKEECLFQALFKVLCENSLLKYDFVL